VRRALRVAHVVPDLDPRSGGPAENVPRLTRALAAVGLQIDLHYSERGAPCLHEPGPGERRHPAPGAWPSRLGRSPAMRSNLLATPADVVHAHCLWMLPLRYAATAARHHSAPLVISPRGMLAPWSMRRSRGRKALARSVLHPGAFRLAAGWHATSEQEADDIRALGFAQPICVAPNGIEEPVQLPDLARAYYGERAPELRGRKILLFHSRFHSKKRILELIRDFATLASRRADWHLLAVGIPEEYTVERVRAEAARHGISGQVTVVDGRGAPKPYALATLFVLPTHDENFGRVVAEALVHGVPVVTTTRTPWSGIEQVRAGAWVPLTEVAAAIDRLTGLTEVQLAEAGGRGRSWVLETYDWQRIAHTLADFYASLPRAASHQG
jgi:glycosyltransferase involved in cell wall biosynthesis